MRKVKFREVSTQVAVRTQTRGLGFRTLDFSLHQLTEERGNEGQRIHLKGNPKAQTREKL